MEDVKKWVTTLFVRKQELIQVVLQLLSTGLFKVGIGKDPTVALDVEGDVSLSGNLAVGGDAAVAGSLDAGNTTIEGNLEVVTGATVVTRLTNGNNVGTIPDIWFSGNAVIASEADLNLIIDSNGDSANAALRIQKDAEGTASATQLMSVGEDGKVKIGAGSPVATLDIAGESLWIREGQTGWLSGSPGKGVRIGYVTATDKGSILAYDYGGGGNKTLAFQTPGGPAEFGGDVSVTGDVTINGNLVFGSASSVVQGSSFNVQAPITAVGHPVYAKGAEGDNGYLRVYADEGDDAPDRYNIEASTGGNLSITNDSYGTLAMFKGSTSQVLLRDVWTATTGVGTTVRVIDSSGLLARLTSSIKYKADVEALPEKWGWGFVRRLRPVIFHSTCAVDDPSQWQVGLVAEEVAAVGGLEQSPYVFYADGEPEGVHYERLTVPLILTLQQQAQYIRGLEQRIAALEAKVG